LTVESAREFGKLPKIFDRTVCNVFEHLWPSDIHTAEMSEMVSGGELTELFRNSFFSGKKPRKFDEGFAER
jgi:hypothetical protein